MATGNGSLAIAVLEPRDDQMPRMYNPTECDPVEIHVHGSLNR